MHHPRDLVTTRAVASGSEISTAPITWMLIIIGIVILVFMIYYIIKLKK